MHNIIANVTKRRNTVFSNVFWRHPISPYSRAGRVGRSGARLKIYFRFSGFYVCFGRWWWYNQDGNGADKQRGLMMKGRITHQDTLGSRGLKITVWKVWRMGSVVGVFCCREDAVLFSDTLKANGRYEAQADKPEWVSA